jgi:hypothetical protein
MLIKDLPKEIQEVVFKRQEEQGNLKNDNIDLEESKEKNNFSWERTKEGYNFWREIYKGNFNVFYQKYPILPYQYLPFPTNGNYFKAKVIKDIIRKDIGTKGSLPDIIRAGSITWFNKDYDSYNIIKNQKNSIVHPENNRFRANIFAEYFEIIEETSMKEIQEECKRRFPIGCKYISAAHSSAGIECILSKDDIVYTIHDDSVYGSYGAGCLYSDGKYAELISLPKSKSEIKLEKDKYYRLKIDSTFFIDKIKSIDCNEGTFDSYGYIDINRKNWISPDEYSIIFDVKECHPATEDEIEWWNICYKKNKYIPNKEELIEEAKRRYPIGTKFYPAHLKSETYCVVTTNNFEIIDYSNNISVAALTESGEEFASSYDIEYSHGGIFSRLVYYEGKWANIVEEKSVEPIVESKNDYIDVGFKIGDRVIGYDKEGIILGFTRDKSKCVIKITDGSRGHDGNGLECWYDDYGLPINYYKNGEDKYFVSVKYLKKLPDSYTLNISQEQYITDIDPYSINPTTSNQSFLIYKSKNSLDTTVQKVSEISIELKQKSKTIKF